jgi:hypothetical protein
VLEDRVIYKQKYQTLRFFIVYELQINFVIYRTL